MLFLLPPPPPLSNQKNKNKKSSEFALFYEKNNIVGISVSEGGNKTIFVYIKYTQSIYV